MHNTHKCTFNTHDFDVETTTSYTDLKLVKYDKVLRNLLSITILRKALCAREFLVNHGFCLSSSRTPC